ncbi:hypothetical protein [Catenulispora subtropica]|uniref:Uncharacterized protein n=1 Tax=Catenulispora subtropica TaxID=450798 RepID=A0ABP5D496_9ACTN
MSMDHIDNTPPATTDNAADVDMPWAPRDCEWSGSAAEARALAWADGDPHKLACVFLYRNPDPSKNPARENDYKFPVADIIDGEPRRVFRAVTHAAGRLDQADIPEADRERVRNRITRLYRSAARAFGDPSIRAPWE